MLYVKAPGVGHQVWMTVGGVSGCSVLLALLTRAGGLRGRTPGRVQILSVSVQVGVLQMAGCLGLA